MRPTTNCCVLHSTGRFCIYCTCAGAILAPRLWSASFSMGPAARDESEYVRFKINFWNATQPCWYNFLDQEFWPRIDKSNSETLPYLRVFTAPYYRNEWKENSTIAVYNMKGCLTRKRLWSICCTSAWHWQFISPRSFYGSEKNGSSKLVSLEEAAVSA